MRGPLAGPGRRSSSVIRASRGFDSRRTDGQPARSMTPTSDNPERQIAATFGRGRSGGRPRRRALRSRHFHQRRCVGAGRGVRMSGAVGRRRRFAGRRAFPSLAVAGGLHVRRAARWNSTPSSKANNEFRQLYHRHKELEKGCSMPNSACAAGRRQSLADEAREARRQDRLTRMYVHASLTMAFSSSLGGGGILVPAAARHLPAHPPGVPPAGCVRYDNPGLNRTRIRRMKRSPEPSRDPRFRPRTDRRYADRARQPRHRGLRAVLKLEARIPAGRSGTASACAMIGPPNSAATSGPARRWSGHRRGTGSASRWSPSRDFDSSSSCPTRWAAKDLQPQGDGRRVRAHAFGRGERASRATTRTWPSGSPANTWPCASSTSSAPGQPGPYEFGTGRILRQMSEAGGLDAIVFGCGSSGTMTGLSRCFAKALAGHRTGAGRPGRLDPHQYITEGTLSGKSGSWMVGHRRGISCHRFPTSPG